MTLRCKDCGVEIQRVRLAGRAPKRCAPCRKKQQEEFKKGLKKRSK